MSEPIRILYCNCTYAKVVPEAVKQQVLEGLCRAGIAFESVADLCEMSAQRDPAMKRLAADTGVIPPIVRRQTPSQAAAEAPTPEATPDSTPDAAAKVATEPGVPGSEAAPQGEPTLKIAACYPRAVKWLFHAADAPLGVDAKVSNMRTESAETVLKELLGG